MTSYKIEAEDLELNGYTAQSNSPDASGGGYVQTWGTGTASTTFGGVAGVYSLDLSVFDENDGQSTIEVLVNGEVVASVKLDQDLNGNWIYRTLTTVSVDGIELVPGDELAFRGIANAGEAARLDSIELTQTAALQNPAGTVTLLQEGFDGVDWNNIASSDFGSQNGAALANRDAELITRTVDMTGFSNGQITIDVEVAQGSQWLEETGIYADEFYVSLNVDGTWVILDTFRPVGWGTTLVGDTTGQSFGQGFGQITYDIPAGTGTAEIKIGSSISSTLEKILVDNITITAESAPVETTDDALTLSEDALGVTVNVLANDTGIPADAKVSLVDTSEVPGGQVSIAPDGTISFNPGSDFQYLNAGESVTFEVTYQVESQAASSGLAGQAIATETVSITVEGQTDVALEALGDAITVTESEADGDIEVLDGGGTDIRANDVANGGGQYAGLTAEVNGSTGNIGAWIDLAGGGRVKINADGTVDFDADGDFEALNDGESAQVTVDYTISQTIPTNDPGSLETRTFSDFSHGDFVTGADGFSVRAVRASDGPNGPNAAMVFDTSETGTADPDLEINDGKLLIISENLDSSDPDDNSGGGTFFFDFDDVSFIDSVRFADIEGTEPGEIRFYDASDALIGTEAVVATGDGLKNLQTVSTAGVARMEIQLNGSGAIDFVQFRDMDVVDTATVTINVLGETDVPLEAVDDFIIVTESEGAGDEEAILDDFADTTAEDSILDNDIAEGGGAYQGAVFTVDGQEANVGTFLDLAGGGRVRINADGSVDFDADGDFELLDDGESAQVSVDYTIQGPPQTGTPPKHNILFVIDVSGSTDDPFAGSPVGDLNGDGASDTILDAEIAAYQALVQQILDSGLTDDDVDIGIIAFSGSSGADQSGASTLLGTFKPSDPALDTALESLTDGGFTNFEAPLQTGIAWYEAQGATTDDENIVYFLSDGRQNVGGTFDDEANEIANRFGASLNAVGVGSDAVQTQLDQIDNTGGSQIVTTSDALTAALVDTVDPVPGAEVAATVTIRVLGETDVPLEAVDDFIIVTESEGAGDEEAILDDFADTTAEDSILDNDIAEGGGAYQGAVFTVDGQEANVGTFLDLAGGGRVRINADGSVDFDADGDFELLDDGESAQVSVDYTIQGPPQTGTPPKHNILFVIDVSGSTDDPFAGSPVGDLNGDGASDTILDAEIAAYQALVQQILDSGLTDDDVDIGIIAFSGSSGADQSGASTLLGTFKPSDPALDTALESLTDGGFTNFEAPLQTGIAWYEAQGATTDDENIVYFLSDGRQNVGGTFDDEANEIANRFGASLNAVGVGSDAVQTQLDQIDNTGGSQIVTTSDALTAALVDTVDPVPGAEVAATVTIRVLGETDVPLEAVDDFIIVTESEGAGDEEAILDDFADTTAEDSILDNDIAEGGGAYQGAVFTVDGQEANVGTFLDLAGGGRVRINADGSVDFDADGDFELLDDGESAQVSVDYTIQGPPQTGTPPKHNILFVIDVSGSTDDPFAGSPVGDLNGDGASDTILDAEIAAYQALVQQILDSGLTDDDVDIGIIAFSGSSGADQSGASTLLGTFKPSDPALDTALESLTDGGFTNFEAPLQTGIAWYEAQGATTDDENIVYFLSDGRQNVGGTFDDEANEIANRFGASLNAVGVGSDAVQTQLDQIDNTGGSQIVTTSDALTAALVDTVDPVPGAEVAATVTIRVLGETDVPLEAVDDFIIVTESEGAGDEEAILDDFADTTAEDSILDNDIAEGGGAYQGAVFTVDGQEANVGTFLDLAGGGRVRINADGSVDFDADGDFELLDDGESAQVSVDYTIQGPPQTGTPPKHNILFVIDVSGSTDDPFAGSPVGDLNGDGASDTILDAEIAAYQALVQQILDSGLTDDDVDIGIIAFSGSSGADQSGASTLLGTFKPSDPALDTALESLTDGGFTNFEAPLQTGIAWYEAQGATTDDENIVYFLSDGRQNVGGTFDDEANEIANRFGASLNAVGVGSDAVQTQLDQIDNTGGSQIVTTSDALTAALVDTVDPVPGAEVAATVTIRVLGETDVPLEAVDDFIIVTESEGAGDEEAILDDFADTTAEDSILDNDIAEGGGAYQGAVFTVDGQEANVGTFLDLAGGGRVRINADGSVDFDADGDFDALDDGESAQVSVDYQIRELTQVDDPGTGGTGPVPPLPPLSPPKHNILFVIDVSGSTDDPFAGSPVGDLNGDGASDTILDAEIAAYQALVQQILDSGLTDDDVDIGIIAFSGSSGADQSGASTLLGTFKPSDPALDTALESLTDGGFTNFEAPLQTGIAWYEAQGATTDDENIVYFLSDGRQNVGGTFDDEANEIANRFGASLNAVGVGSDAVLDQLNQIDNTGGAEIVTTSDALTAALVGTFDPVVTEDSLTVGEDEGADGQDTLDNGEDSVLANDVNAAGTAAQAVIAVGGDAANVGAFVDLANGGRVKINADGTIDFDADGDFDGLNTGESAQVAIDYTVEFTSGPDGPPKHNILFVIDVSGSTDDPFAGSPVGDLNGDGISNTILDAEIAAYQALVQQILDSGLTDDDVDIGVIAFSGVASANQSGASTLLGTFKPSDPALDTALESLTDGGFTNFEAPLQTGIAWYEAQGATTDDENIVYFLSDGRQNVGGTFDDEANEIANRFGASLNAVGVGLDAVQTQLDLIDNTGGSQIVTTSDALTAALVDTVDPVTRQETTRVVITVQGETGSTTSEIVDEATVNIRILGEDEPIGTIEGRAFIDTNDDSLGIDAAGAAEAGLDGIEVRLLDEGGNAVLDGNGDAITTTTAGGGLYSFVDIPAGRYIVEFGDDAGGRERVDQDVNGNADDTIDSDADPVDGRTAVLDLQPQSTLSNVDAGYEDPLGAISGRYFLDTNRNNIDDNEPGIGPRTVRLLTETGQDVLDANGDPLVTTTDPATGAYRFDGINPGTYIVAFEQPGGVLEFAGANEGQTGGTDVDNDSDVIDPATGFTEPFVVVAGAETTDIDAGAFVPAGSISGRAFIDSNDDSLEIDANGDPEAGLGGIEVRLLDTGLNAVLDANGNAITATTDTQGFYTLGGLVDGDYVVAFGADPAGRSLVDQDAGTDNTIDSDADPVSGQTGTISVGINQAIADVDAGYEDPRTSTLSGRAFIDTNDDSLEIDAVGGQEAGLGGIVVSLLLADGTPVLDSAGQPVTATTEANGSYSFAGLAAGTYSVTFSADAGGRSRVTQDVDGDISDDIDSDASPTGLVSDIVIGVGEDVIDVDAGYEDPQSSSISGRAFIDSNDDSLEIDANGDPEAGLGGIEVRLLDTGLNAVLDANGNAITATTDTQGFYTLGGLVDGDYVVAFGADPAGRSLVDQDAGTDNTIDSDADPVSGQTGTISVGINQAIADVDAGYEDPRTSTLSGRAFIDTNDDSLEIDAVGGQEAGLGGIVVSLLLADGTPVLDSAGQPVTATTEANGSYSFADLAAGTYSVTFSADAGGRSRVTQDVDGDISDDIDSDASPTGLVSDIVIGVGEDVIDVDAGYEDPQSSSISGRAFIDSNDDSLEIDANGDPEAGIEGVTVQLLNTDFSTTGITATTDINGAYTLTNIAAGTYLVFFDQAAGGRLLVDQNVGTDDTIDSDPNPANGQTLEITVGLTETIIDVDAGYEDPRTASIEGRYFIDQNNNDLDDGEPAVVGAMVSLFLSDGTDTGLTDMTDGTGAYAFTNLAAGDYVVVFGPDPDGRDFVAPDAGQVGDVDPDNDSDVIDPITGETAPITLDIGDAVTDVDAGVEEFRGAISGRYFLDNDKDNVDDGAPVDGILGGLGVRLLNANGTAATDDDGNPITTTTDATTGAYSFENLVAGTYIVEFDQPGGFLEFVEPNVGQVGAVDVADDSDVINDVSGRTDVITVTPGNTTTDVDAGALDPRNIIAVEGIIETGLPADQTIVYIIEDSDEMVSSAFDSGAADVDGDGVVGSLLDTTLQQIIDRALQVDELGQEYFQNGQEFHLIFSNNTGAQEITLTAGQIRTAVANNDTPSLLSGFVPTAVTFVEIDLIDGLTRAVDYITDGGADPDGGITDDVIVITANDGGETRTFSDENGNRVTEFVPVSGSGTPPRDLVQALQDVTDLLSGAPIGAEIDAVAFDIGVTTPPQNLQFLDLIDRDGTADLIQPTDSLGLGDDPTTPLVIEDGLVNNPPPLEVTGDVETFEIEIVDALGVLTTQSFDPATDLAFNTNTGVFVFAPTDIDIRVGSTVDIVVGLDTDGDDVVDQTFRLSDLDGTPEAFDRLIEDGETDFVFLIDTVPDL